MDLLAETYCPEGYTCLIADTRAYEFAYLWAEEDHHVTVIEGLSIDSEKKHNI